MVYQFGYRKVGSNKLVVIIYPNTFNERKEVLPNLIAQFFKRLKEAIPFEFNKDGAFKIRQMKNKRMLDYWCLERIIEFKIPAEEAIELLKQKGFQPKIPL